MIGNLEIKDDDQKSVFQNKALNKKVFEVDEIKIDLEKTKLNQKTGKKENLEKIQKIEKDEMIDKENFCKMKNSCIKKEVNCNMNSELDIFKNEQNKIDKLHNLIREKSKKSEEMTLPTDDEIKKPRSNSKINESMSKLSIIKSVSKKSEENKIKPNKCLESSMTKKKRGRKPKVKPNPKQISMSHLQISKELKNVKKDLGKLVEKVEKLMKAIKE